MGDKVKTDSSVGKGGGVNVEMQRRGAGRQVRVSLRGRQDWKCAVLKITKRQAALRLAFR